MAYMGGFWDTIKNTVVDIAQGVGATPAIAAAVAKAYASPSLSNIQGVQNAYAAEGTTPPPEVLQFLYNRYYETFQTSFPTGLIASVGSYGPWILAGGVLLLLAFNKRR